MATWSAKLLVNDIFFGDENGSISSPDPELPRSNAGSGNDVRTQGQFLILSRPSDRIMDEISILY